jgi:uncharacterized damage-inducible protein DinB
MAGLVGQDAVMTKTELDSKERTDLISALANQRQFLRQTVEGLTDDQISRRTTPSELCLGGIIKHVTYVEANWLSFIEQGPSAVDSSRPAAIEEHADSFRVGPGETVAVLLERYGRVAQRAETLIAELPSLDDSHPLPPAPWFEPNARWSARTVLLHILAETAQHSGHADVIREALDGAKTMG